ncbi:MAG: hypothetical protein N2447_08125 [Thermoanaerobaculum sp.]|nr:hypothetical protein [Thermoanaerobaculum sp.]
MKGYATVRVRLLGKTVVCEPDPVTLYFKTGPDCLRFTFRETPREVASVVIQWKDDGRPLFSGMGSAPSSVGSHLPDLITRGNCQVPGRYSYAVHMLDAQGNLVGEVDPNVDNKEAPP